MCMCVCVCERERERERERVCVCLCSSMGTESLCVLVFEYGYTVEGACLPTCLGFKVLVFGFRFRSTSPSFFFFPVLVLGFRVQGGLLRKIVGITFLESYDKKKQKTKKKHTS